MKTPERAMRPGGTKCPSDKVLNTRHRDKGRKITCERPGTDSSCRASHRPTSRGSRTG